MKLSPVIVLAADPEAQIVLPEDTAKPSGIENVASAKPAASVST